MDSIRPADGVLSTLAATRPAFSGRGLEALEAVPAPVRDRDDGHGDPAGLVRAGEAVLVLSAGMPAGGLFLAATIAGRDRPWSSGS